jgi:hypothetical protein
MIKYVLVGIEHPDLEEIDQRLGDDLGSSILTGIRGVLANHGYQFDFREPGNALVVIPEGDHAEAAYEISVGHHEPVLLSDLWDRKLR